jgi:hypothetical protein
MSSVSTLFEMNAMTVNGFPWRSFCRSTTPMAAFLDGPIEASVFST